MKQHIILKPIHLLWIALIVASPLLGGCQKEKLPNEISTLEDAYRAIVGKWEWKETIIRHRGQETPIYKTPDTENMIIQDVFLKNRKSNTVETINKISTRTDYEYNITVDASGGEGYSSIFVLTSTNINTNEKHHSTFQFKNTLVFLLRSPSVEFYYVRK